MINPGFVDRINLLMQQHRYGEARSMLETHLTNHPQDSFAQYCFAYVLFMDGDLDQSRSLTADLLTEDPENVNVLELSIRLDIEDKKFETAESKAELLLELNSGDSDAFMMMAQVKMGKRSYDKALSFTEQALELDAENLNALNLKIALNGLLGNASNEEAIKSALQLDAENPSSIANHGLELMRQGKVDEALERLKYALSLDPNNSVAQYGMQEALKSKFWIYRMFYKYKMFSARLSEKGSWSFIIGTYIVYQVVRVSADKFPTLAPFLTPLMYAILSLFLLSWIIDPLMNLYLFTNKYGRHLLNKMEKNSSILVGASLVLCIISLVVYFSMDIERFLYLALIFGLSMIPFGSFLIPTDEATRKKLVFVMGGIFLVSVIGTLAGLPNLFLLFALSVFVYSFVLNSILIKGNARVFE